MFCRFKISPARINTLCIDEMRCRVTCSDVSLIFQHFCSISDNVANSPQMTPNYDERRSNDIVIATRLPIAALAGKQSSSDAKGCLSYGINQRGPSMIQLSRQQRWKPIFDTFPSDDDKAN